MSVRYIDIKAFIQMGLSPHAFGMEMNGRKWQGTVNNFRFSYNGKESASELASGDYDFGERILDGRVGRWMTWDPLRQKYPGLSPYNFAGNNPIMFVDHEGKDYGVYVDHSKNTIIIKATLYVTQESKASAELAAVSWNKESNKYQYKVGEGNNQKLYDINFEITVKSYDDPFKRDLGISQDKSGEANLFMVVKDGMLGDDYGRTYSINNNEGGANKLLITESSEKRQTGKHELGHALGLGHFFNGIMKEGSSRNENENNVTRANVKETLRREGIGQMEAKGLGAPIDEKAPNKPSAKSHTVHKGEEPSNFTEGEVIKVEKRID